MTTEKHSAKTPAPAEQDNNTRIGLWVGLGTAAAAAAGVLAMAFYTHYQDEKTTVSEPAAAVAASETAPSVIPTSEAQAASIAAATSDEQSKGMTAPSDVETTSAPAASAAAIDPAAAAQAPASTPAASTPAQTILAQENAVHAETKVLAAADSVQFYFAKGKSDMAANTLEALKGIVEGVKNGTKAVIVSHADSETNANLTKERASAVRTVLLAAGVPEGSIEIREPAASGEDSRRVDVVLQ
ncbi:OmpA family protein [Conchiformibius steedae DSM 2580]|uniref:OmpA family protein n=1 Tax=Conchiformibius steedae DSM 2580 TaxID=1121352 RepID=A0AAE9HRZ4_9NEIS|nr:OmpA family protein [Conchiformibius steedae]QMT34229.1 OmpA family protein [Conchiformibius steedae]URD67002.1 OmpA family protein [Conchiformibius steedae DSM 2580]